MVLKEVNKFDKNWEENFNCLAEYINSSEEAKKRFDRTGNIDRQAVIENNGKKIKIGSWLNSQKQYLLKKYQGMSIEEIKKDETIPEDDKYRMLKLLNLGVSFPKKMRELEWWDKKYELLEQYINSSEGNRTKFEKYGFIEENTIIQSENETIAIGKWLNAQREVLMKKYQNRSIQEIENDENIPNIDKFKMKKLLELGVSYPQNIKEMYTEKKGDYIDVWNKNFELLEKYLNSSEEAKKTFIETGKLKLTGNKLQDDDIERINRWIVCQKQSIMKEFSGKTIEEIGLDENIHPVHKYKMKKLLEIGVRYSRDNIDWDVNFELLKEFINSSEQAKIDIQKKGIIDYKSIIEKDGRKIKIGIWLMNQRNSLMKKYNGKTIKEIMKDKAIPEKDKNRMKKLLELGISYPKIHGQKIGKATYDTKVEDCDDAEFKLKKLKQEKIKINNL